MPSYSTDHLRTLVAVLDEGTFDAAASRLHVTASAVSQRIKAMEEATGQILVQRTNPARATDTGAIVARYARQVDLLGEDLRRELGDDGHDGHEKTAYSIAIGVNADSLATWFLPALATASERFGTMFEVHRDDEDYTVGLLRSGTVMAAVTATEQPVQGCTSSLLGAMRYKAVAMPAFLSRWSAHSNLHDNLDDLARIPVVDFDRKDELQRDFVRRVIGREPSGPRHLIPASADFARSILLGLGWGLLPEQQANEHLRTGALLELAPQHPIDVRLYWQRWNLTSPLLDGLTNVVRESAAAQLRP